MRIAVHVSPRASRNEIKPNLLDSSLKVYLTAPPVEGKANEALVELLAEHFHVPKTNVRIIKGETARNKIVEIKNRP